MKVCTPRALTAFALIVVLYSLPGLALAQDSATVLAGADLQQVVPQGFYFLGRTAPTQMRNAAAARFGKDRHVIAGMVDTAGYAVDVRQKFEGFLITDSPISIGGSELGTGAYGFGFTSDGKFVVQDQNSLNGTFLNDQLIKGPHLLTNGDIILIGISTLKFQER